jgi:nitroreductase
VNIQALLTLMRKRKSIRTFDPGKTISSSDLNLIFEAGRTAPSAGNMQTWHFFLIRDADKKEAIVRAAYGQSFIATAPLVIVSAIDKVQARRRYGTRGVQLYGIQDTSAAIEHILLAARALGIGSCWIGAFSEEDLEQALGIDRERYRTVAIIPMGYSKEEPGDKGRMSIDTIVTEL